MMDAHVGLARRARRVVMPQVSMRCPTLAELPAPPDGCTGWPWTEGSPILSELAPDERRWPRISIVTPSFNQGEFVEASLRSVLLQGYPNLEIIVVDGGSNDGSVDTISRYGRWLTRWSSERDAGPAQALNKGFKLATGEILGFLNADDFYLPGGLAKIAREFRMYPSADVVSGHGFLATPSGQLGVPVFSDPWNAKNFEYGTCVFVQQSTFFRRRTFEQIGGFNEQMRTSWDMELWADLARAGACFHGFDEFVAAFRLHSQSITGSPGLRAQRLQDTRAILEKFRGRQEAPRDHFFHLVHRVRKFCGHPRRTLKQRAFLYSTLKRWSM
jgi:glycosyltransferase involved in cell wall biosynthesis